MFKRDENGLKMAKRDNANYVCASLETGKIIGYFSYISNARWIGVELNGTEVFTIKEYEYMTDDTRDRTVTTAADLYDKVEWTSKGFKIDGENVPIN
jgi:hypothetical protein